MDTARSATHQLRAQLEVQPLRTSRLILRLPRRTDALLIYDGYARDEAAIRWMGFRPHSSVATVEDVVGSWVKNWERGQGMLAFVLETVDDSAFAGVVDVTVDSHGARIGYVLPQRVWGRGFATEAVRRVIDLSFEHFKVWRAWATCATENVASRRVLEKAGMKHEGVLRRWIVSPLVSSEPHDSDCLSLTRDDWLAARLSHDTTSTTTTRPN